MFADLRVKFGQPCQILGWGHTDCQTDPGFNKVSQSDFIKDYLSHQARQELFGHQSPWTDQEINAKAEKWINSIGINERSFFSGTVSEMGLIAARRCLKNAGFNPADLKLIIGGSNTHERYPSLADQIKCGLGQSSAACWDITEACVTNAAAIQSGVAQIRSGLASNVLVVCSEKATILANRDKYLYSNLFGDGAFAVLLAAGVQDSFLAFDIISLPEDGQIDLIYKTDDGFEQNGPKVHGFVGKQVVDFLNKFLTKAGIDPSEVDHLIPHQPSRKTLDLLEKEFRKICPNFKGQFHRNVETMGNLSSVSPGLIIASSIESGVIKPDELKVIITFGSGLSIGAYAFR
ncbi:MAG: hypothetical protein COU22_02030 [Candidatus Komeilibacteria bacterium CG10_big_fil_rev_8_21_14_0_10_41_13]|uniref:3-oxoacyl-ACP synthase n=1 Tax=Candidatus Komeilibacteria bacterium CG10_big_fil_rev_8_21_14_0_10_41_13 TaxID=1974476 RepID=A0A2M6WCG8_9BACT|nr:MAG: hypothetical protein COU22_02030 [Candidatus Komeilibacteria bacterium CG10_big_fil_rev_8_21_14_0_10_41_13]